MRTLNKALAIATAAVAIAGLSACSAQSTHEAMCAYVIGDGLGDSRNIKDIITPGEKEYTVDDQTRFVPCNARNYAFVPNLEGGGDSAKPVVFKTKSVDGVPGTEMRAYVTAYFQLNQNEEAMRAFWPFCSKYDCASTSDETSGDVNFASAGWVGTLNESVQPASLRAAAEVGPQFGLEVVEQSSWPALADAMTKVMNDKLRVITQSKHDFFCGSYTQEDGKENCTPIRFEVDKVEPTDPAVAASLAARGRIDSDKARVAAERELGIAQREAAQQKYGSETDRVLGDLARIQACKEAGTACTMVFGSSASVAVANR